MDRVATGFGYDLATLTREDGTARWANARKLMRLAREFEAREGPDLGGFLDYLDSRAASRDREAEAATRAEGHAGVRVMTVHAAKGLEFGVVAVADLGRSLQLGWAPLRVAPGEDGPDGGEAARVGVQLGRLGRPGERLHDYEELTELAAEREAEEEARLAYVAATRAKRRLLLSGTFNPNAAQGGVDPAQADHPTSWSARCSVARPAKARWRCRRLAPVPPPGACASASAHPAPGSAPGCWWRGRRSEPTEAADAEPPLGGPRRRRR